MIYIVVPSFAGHRKGYLKVISDTFLDSDYTIVNLSEIWLSPRSSRLDFMYRKFKTSLILTKELSLNLRSKDKIILLDSAFLYWMPIITTARFLKVDLLFLDFQNSFRKVSLRLIAQLTSHIFRNFCVLTTNLDLLEGRWYSTKTFKYLPDFFTSASPSPDRNYKSSKIVEKKRQPKIGLSGLNLERKGADLLRKLSMCKGYPISIHDSFVSDDMLDSVVDEVDMWWVGYPKWKQGISFIHYAIMRGKPVIGLANTHSGRVIEKYKIGFVVCENLKIEDHFDPLCFEKSCDLYLRDNSPGRLRRELRFWSAYANRRSSLSF